MKHFFPYFMRVINKNSRYHTTFDGEMNFAVLSFQLRYCDLDRETYGLFVKNNSTSGIVATPSPLRGCKLHFQHVIIQEFGRDVIKTFNLRAMQCKFNNNQKFSTLSQLRVKTYVNSKYVGFRG